MNRRKLSALRKAWSSNLLDYLTTLELIQSDNGAQIGAQITPQSTQLGYWVLLAPPPPLTSRSSWPRIHGNSKWNPSSLSCPYLQARSACRQTKLLRLMTDFSTSSHCRSRAAASFERSFPVKQVGTANMHQTENSRSKKLQAWRTTSPHSQKHSANSMDKKDKWLTLTLLWQSNAGFFKLIFTVCGSSE